MFVVEVCVFVDGMRSVVSSRRPWKRSEVKRGRTMNECQHVKSMNKQTKVSFSKKMKEQAN